MVKNSRKRFAVSSSLAAPEHRADLATRSAPGKCVECGATSTPQWREGPCGPKTLCNACGVRHLRALKKAAEQAAAAAVAEQKRARAAREAAVTPSSTTDDQEAAHVLRKSRRLSLGNSYAGHTSCSELTAGLQVPAQSAPVAEFFGFEGDQEELEVAEELLCLAAGSASDGASEGMALAQQGTPQPLRLPVEVTRSTDSNGQPSADQHQHTLQAGAATMLPSCKQQGREVVLQTQPTLTHLPMLRATRSPPTTRRLSGVGPRYLYPAAAGSNMGFASAMCMDAAGVGVPSAASGDNQDSEQGHARLVKHEGLVAHAQMGMQPQLQQADAAAHVDRGSPSLEQASAGAGGTAEGSSCEGTMQPTGTAAAAMAAAAQLSLSSLTDQERAHLAMLQQALAEAQARMRKAEQEQQQVFQAEAQLARLRVRQYAQTLQQELVQLSLYCLLHRSQPGTACETAAAPGGPDASVVPMPASSEPAAGPCHTTDARHAPAGAAGSASGAMYVSKDVTANQ